MNLYLVLALALGAATPAPLAPPTAARIVATRRAGVAVCGPASAGLVQSDRLKPARTHRGRLAARAIVLTGSATPRAPAAL